jgi:2,4'-dihydroxyacetophenone dioxygenase
MSSTAEANEFWRNIKPIPNAFKPDTLAEVYIANAPSQDERYYVPFSETVSSRPLWISPSTNRWCDVLMAKSAGLVNRHYHPHEVFAYTISGQWSYPGRVGAWPGAAPVAILLQDKAQCGSCSRAT